MTPFFLFESNGNFLNPCFLCLFVHWKFYGENYLHIYIIAFCDAPLLHLTILNVSFQSVLNEITKNKRYKIISGDILLLSCPCRMHTETNQYSLIPKQMTLLSRYEE